MLLPYHQSDLIRGLVVEDEYQLRNLAALFDKANATNLLKVKGRENLKRFTHVDLDRWFAKPSTPNSSNLARRRGDGANYARLMLLCRMADVSGIEITGRQNTATLNDIGLKIEKSSLGYLRKLDKTFTGDSNQNLTRHILEKIFKNWEQQFAELPASTQDEKIAEILSELNKLPSEYAERLKKTLKTDEFTAELLRGSMISGTFSIGLATVVSVSGFAAYTTLTSALSGAAGIIGLTLPFGTYMFATSLLAFITNPAILAPTLLVGGAWMLKRANRKMRQIALPTLVGLILARTAGNTLDPSHTRRLISMINYYLSLSPEEREAISGFINDFPGLGRLD